MRWTLSIVILLIIFGGAPSAAQVQCQLQDDVPNPVECLARCQTAPSCKSALLELDARKKAYNETRESYEKAVEQSFRTVIWDAATGQQRRDDISAVAQNLAALNKTITANAYTELGKPSGSPNKFIESLSAAVLAPDAATFNTKMREVHEHLLTKGRTPFHEELDGLSTELERIAGQISALAASINKGQASLKNRVPSPLLGPSTDNVFRTVALAFDAHAQSLSDLKKKNGELERARTDASAQIALLNSPGRGTGGPGGTVTVRKALFGEPAAVRSAFSTYTEGAGGLRQGICVATGYFKRECEYISATLKICRNLKTGILTLKTDCISTEGATKEEQAGTRLEMTPRPADQKLKLCAAKVDLDQTCGGHNPAINQRRLVIVGFDCGGGAPESRWEALEGETLYLYCR